MAPAANCFVASAGRSFGAGDVVQDKYEIKGTIAFGGLGWIYLALDTVLSAAEAKGITLIAKFGNLPEQVLGDSTRLQQVVWNLLTNAVKFTP